MSEPEQQALLSDDVGAAAPVVPWWKRRMCGLDIETTREVWESDGPDVNEERIVSLAVALVGGDGETWSHTWLVNPGFPIPPESTAIHGIHDEDVADCPPVEDILDDVMDVLREVVAERMALVAYNAPYDLTVLHRALGRAGRAEDQELLKALLVIDPMICDRLLDTFRKGSRKLANTIAIWEARAKRIVEDAGRVWRAGGGSVLERERGGPHEAAADAIGACRLAWLLGVFGDVYSYDRPVRLNRSPKRDMLERQRRWDRESPDLEKLFAWQREWRREDQLRLRELWRAEGNPKWEGVQPDWPIYPPGVKVG